MSRRARLPKHQLMSHINHDTAWLVDCIPPWGRRRCFSRKHCSSKSIYLGSALIFRHWSSKISCTGHKKRYRWPVWSRPCEWDWLWVCAGKIFSYRSHGSEIGSNSLNIGIFHHRLSLTPVLSQVSWESSHLSLILLPFVLVLNFISWPPSRI